MQNRKLLSIIFGFLLITPGIPTLQSAPSVYNVLNELDAKVSPASAEVTIKFNIPVNYIGHSPQKSGKVILIRVRPLGQNPPDTQTFSKTPTTSTSYKNDERLPWTATSTLPLDEVRYMGSTPGGPTIEVLFARKVSFSIVQSRDFRSLTIIVARSNVDKKSNSISNKKSKYSYTINLNTSTKPFNLKRINRKQYPRGFTFYTLSTNVEGKTLHHLRVGFFHSAADIRKALVSIRPYYKRARVILASQNDLASAKQANPRQTVASTTKKFETAASKNETAASLMTKAKKALIGGNYHKATVLYGRVVTKYKKSPQAKKALEFLGVAYQRDRRFTIARSVYQGYLRKYPRGKDAVRVRQRLNALVTAANKPQRRLAKKKGKQQVRWQTYGNSSTTIRQDEHKASNSPIKTTTRSIVTSLNATTSRRTKKSTVKARFSGSYAENLTGGTNTGRNYRVSYMYIDYRSRIKDYSMRLGRQAKNSGGVLGRFDGASIEYQLSPRWKLNAVAGFPVNLSSDDAISTEKYFIGANVDITTSSKYLGYNLFTIHQMIDGITDRNSIGGEVRYLHPKHSVFVVVDYDVSYQELNKFLVVNNWRFPNKSTFNLVFDHRRNPILTTSNALQGQAVTGIKELLLTYTEDQIRQLAEDRTATFTSLSLSGSYPLSKNWLLNGSIVVSKLDSTPASGGVAATPGTDNEVFYSLQAIRSNWIKDGNSTIFAIRYADTTTYDKLTLSAQTRYPLANKWRIIPRFDIDTRDLNDGSDIFTLKPSLRVTYRPKRRYRFEAESGWSQAEYNNSVNDRTETDTYFSLNFIADF